MNSVYYIGIDGGGTKTEAILTNREGVVMARAKTDATNPNDVGIETSVARMHDLVAQLLLQTGISESQIYVFAGISGALNHKSTLTQALTLALPNAAGIEIGSDIVNLMYAELPLGDGACVICGTGSACFLRCEDELYRIGGWGYLLDSAGSGYDFGRMALEAALKDHDGRGPATALTDMLTERLGKPVWEALTDIYTQGKPYIASCAPLVFQAAAQGDAVAERIMTLNAGALAEMIDTAVAKRRALGRPASTPLPVAMGGSINQKEAPAWTARVSQQLTTPHDVTLTVAEVPMVVGAVLKALTCENPHITPDDYAVCAARVKQSYLAFMQKA